MAELDQSFDENDLSAIPENSQPEEENSQPEDENSQPEDENSQPEDENSQPEDENSQPEDDNSQPEDENIQPEHDIQPEEKQELNDTVPGVVENKWPGWPGESVFRILVPTQKVGGIIGRKGEFIKKMCEEAKARIKILDGPPGIAERAVMVSAKDDPDSTLPPAVDGLLRVHKRIVDGLEMDGSRAQPVAGGKVSTRLLAPAAQAGSLIGKQGTTVKSIQEASSCIVRVLGAEDLPLFALQDDRIVEIVGEPLGVHKAVELIASHLRKFVVDRSVIPMFEMQMQMPNPQMEQHMPPPAQSWGPPPQSFPANQPGYGGGNGGPGYGGGNGGGPGYGGGNGGPGYGGGNGAAGYGGNNPHYMPPPRQQQHENYYPPAEMPPQMEKQQPHHGISAYGREAQSNVHAPSNAQPAPSMITQVTQQMQIPLSYADAVIGTAGSSISYIRRASGATVAIQETRGVPGEMTVEISGTASQVQTAQQLIQNSMAEAAAAAGSTQAQTQAPPADQSYNPYATQHGSVYAEPPSSAAQTGAYAQAGGYGQAGGAYGSVYGSNYGY